MKTWEIVVSGTVQGVGYRYFTIRTAIDLNLTGTVKNLPDGRVRVLARGEIEALNKLLIELKNGPGFARVTEIILNELPRLVEYEDFRIEY